MPSDKRIKKKAAQFFDQAKPDPPAYRMFLKRLALKPLIIVSLLLCAGAAFAAYRVYFNPRGEITAPTEGSLTDRVVELQGFTKNIPPEHQYIWIAVDVPDIGHCWPKRQIYSINDRFKAKFLELGPNENFTVSLYAVPRNVHLDILAWIKDCWLTKAETGFRMILDSLRLDSITLKLETT